MRRLILCFTVLVSLTILFPQTIACSAPKKELWSRWTSSDATSQQTIDHTEWQHFLSKYVKTNEDNINLVDYAAVKPDQKDKLNNYIWRLSQIPIDKYNRNEQAAFWINLYNALTVKTILDHYPVKTIRDINISPGFFNVGPWDANIVKVDKTWISLNDIEHRILRPIWNDPRLHYALNCAALGCPNLAKTPYTGNKLDAQLNHAAKTYINSPRGVAVISNQLVVSKMYEWFKKDFGGTDQAIIKHILPYASPTLQKKLQKMKKISDTIYNWNLNGVPQKIKQ